MLSAFNKSCGAYDQDASPVRLAWTSLKVHGTVRHSGYRVSH